MDQKEKELVDQIKENEARIHKEEQALKPYWPWLVFFSWCIPPFWEGGETCFAIGGFWLGVAVSFVVFTFNRNDPHKRVIEACREHTKILQRALDNHRRSLSS